MVALMTGPLVLFPIDAPEAPLGGYGTGSSNATA
jgi:hypothetical protein